MQLIDNLAEYEEIGSKRADEEEPPEPGEDGAAPASPLTGEADRTLVLCAGSRGPLDEVAAAMLASLVEREGMASRLLAHTSLYSARLKDVDLDGVAAVVLSYMNTGSLAHARFLVRRLRRRLPGARFIVGVWTLEPDEISRRDPLTATSADYVATSLAEAIRQLRGEVSEAPETERSPDEARRNPGPPTRHAEMPELAEVASSRAG